MLYGVDLYHAGIGVICASLGLGAVLMVVFSVTGRKLRRTLDQEYGEKLRK